MMKRGNDRRHEKKPNENHGRDKTVVWWVELVILHMVLLTMCRKLSWCHRFSTLPCVMQRQVLPNYKNVQKLRISAVNRWSGQCSCRGAEASSHHSKQKKTFCFSQFCLFCCLFVSKNDTLKKLWNTFLVFVDI